MPNMRTTIDALKDAEIRNQVLVMVGGAPVNQSFANEIGADLYASNATSAAKLAKSKIEANQIPFS
jgi:5-methyltetrahydrofolate--homocysteine methyltransferase